MVRPCGKRRPRLALCLAPRRQRPSLSRTMRVTSPPSARPRVSRMTWPTMTPIGFMSPARRRSAMSGLASSAAWTAGSSVAGPPVGAGRVLAGGPGRAGAAEGAEPLGLDDRRRVAALGHEPVEDLLRAALRDLL